MWKNYLDKSSFDDKDIAFVIKNKRNAPKELLIRLGLEEESVSVESEAKEVKKTSKKTK